MKASTGRDWSAEGYARNARFVADLATPVVELLAPRLGERILDLGCGDGALTERIVALGPEVVGLDSSPDLLAAARRRGLDVVEGDAQALAFDGAFDAVFSNAALHWMLDAAAVTRGVAKALRPGGRYVAEMGGLGNVAAVATALRFVLDEAGIDAAAVRPWYFPSPSTHRRLLEAQGFHVISIELVPRPTPLPTGIEGWLETFGDPFLRHLPAERRADAAARTIDLLRPALFDEAEGWIADYVRLRFKAVKSTSENQKTGAPS